MVLDLAPHMDLVEVVLAHSYRQRFEAVLDEAATLVKVERGFIASGDGQLDQPQARMVLRFSQRRLYQLKAEPLLADRARHVHAKQRRLVPGLLQGSKARPTIPANWRSSNAPNTASSLLVNRDSHQLNGIVARSRTLEVNACGCKS